MFNEIERSLLKKLLFLNTNGPSHEEIKNALNCLIPKEDNDELQAKKAGLIALFQNECLRQEKKI